MDLLSLAAGDDFNTDIGDADDGEATDTDCNVGVNEVKRRREDALRGGCRQQSWQSSKQDAAVQCNHRVEGFLCVSPRSHRCRPHRAHTHTPASNTTCVALKSNSSLSDYATNHFAIK